MGCMGFPVQAKGIAPAPIVPAKANKTEAKTTASTSTAKQEPVKVTIAATSATTKVDAKPASTIVLAANNATPTNTATVASAKPATSPRPTAQVRPSTSVALSRTSSPSSSRGAAGERLARLTAYWSGEGDYYTGRGMSSTGIHLHQGHCAVDPRIIPYGSVVQITGLGKYLAVDTGSAVISREAAREAAHTPEERAALVIDLYFESRRDGERFAASGPKYAAISWSSPRSTASTQDASGVAAE